MVERVSELGVEGLKASWFHDVLSRAAAALPPHNRVVCMHG